MVYIVEITSSEAKHIYLAPTSILSVLKDPTGISQREVYPYLPSHKRETWTRDLWCCDADGVQDCVHTLDPESIDWTVKHNPVVVRQMVFLSQQCGK